MKPPPRPPPPAGEIRRTELSRREHYQSRERLDERVATEPESVLILALRE
jgi:hypothetical protein